MAKAIIWCRVSTTAQEFESQKKDLLTQAKKDGFKQNDLIVIGKAGASAIKMNELYQKEVNELISAIDSQSDISCIYVWEVSRLARNEVAFYQMKDKIIKSHIQLICNVPQIKLLDDNGEVNNGMEITLNLLVTLAKQEMEIKAKRFSRGKKRRADEQKYNGGAIPFGYRVDDERDKLIVVDENDGEIVKLIYDLYEKGFSQPRIAKELNDTGRANIKLSLINNILTNESYTGIKRKTKNASYERAYPQIISRKQYDKCRKIASENNTTANKARNIYYANRLMKCPTCGAYWSASGSKVMYHCAAAYKPNWEYEYHKKKRCTNKSSISINVLDSLLWYAAIELEAKYIEQATEENIKNYQREAEPIKQKLLNINPRIEELYSKRERLQEMYVDGMKKEVYDKKKEEISDALKQIRAEEISYKNELKRIDAMINAQKVALSQQQKPITTADIIDVISGKRDGVSSMYPIQHARLKQKILAITDEKERYKIIHRQIKSIEIKTTNIRFPFKSGEKDVKAREIIMHTYIGNNGNEGLDYYMVISNGGSGPILIGFSPSEIDDDTPMLHDYDNNSDYYFEDLSVYYQQRYTDTSKKNRRNEKRSEVLSKVGNKITIKQISERYSVSANRIYYKIYKGLLPHEIIGGIIYVLPEDAESVFGPR